MPLKRGKSREIIRYNIRAEKASGKSTRQSVAIALHKAGIKRKARGKKKHVRIHKRSI